MKKLIPLLLLILIGCNKLKGEKGDKGDPGPGNVTTYTGSVISDTQIISVPAYKTSSDIAVFIGAGGGYTETPYFMPGLGINVYYAAMVGVLTLYNAQTANATNYKIVVITNASSSGLQAILP